MEELCINCPFVSICDGDCIFHEKDEDMFKGNCEYCEGAKPLIIGETNDRCITISFDKLIAYGYDVHGNRSNGLSVKIKYCPMCGREL